ncbi:hypothetical protein [Bradyrhizobium sp. HKCCYLS20291]|uniref:hypothetical protein n=1 Tax=Bradyrhizobium sp. HKCCYLS20291 TaxID=3420766 RepID=UPI003EB74A4D
MAIRSGRVFFRYVWRFNALAIAIGALVFLVIGCYAMLRIFKEETRDRRVTNVVNVSEQDKISEDLVLGRPSIIDGTSYVQIPLYRSQSFGGSLYYDKTSDTNVVNYLFLDPSVSQPRWLFPTGGQLIVSSQFLFRQMRSVPEQPRQAVGIIYAVVEKDSNGDGRLTSKDAVSVAVSDVQGGGFRKLLDGVGRLDAVQQIADDKVMLLYQKDQETIVEVYGLPSMERLSQSSIPKIRLK